MILAYTRQVDNALILLGGIKTSKTYWIGLGFLPSNTLYHEESTQAIDKLIPKAPLIQESLILLITRFYELFFSNQIQKALTLINEISDSSLKAQLLEHLVPAFYDIQIMVRE